jgi:ParB family chromosome partitioning protein
LELLGEVETAYNNSNKGSKSGVVEIEVNKIKPNPNQPRRIFDEEKLKELSDSIVAHGLIQPVTVIESSDDEYTLIAGERRLRAHKLANLEVIKAIIVDIEELRLRELALIENIQRDDLNVIELAYSYAQLINEHNITHEELSKRVFKSRTSITNTLRLLQLSSYVQQMLANDKISAGHAKVLLGLDEETQKKVVDSITGQKLSVRETEDLVRKLKSSEKDSEKKSNKNKKENFDFSPLEKAINTLKNSQLKVKAEKNYFKIEIKSQEDIEKISNYFGNTL